MLVLNHNVRKKDFVCVCLLPLAHLEERLIFTSKGTTAWHHGVGNASLNTHLHSLDSPIAMEAVDVNGDSSSTIWQLC